MRLAVLAFALSTLAACSDPTITIELTYREQALKDRRADPAVVTSFTVSVLDAETIGRKLDRAVATCDDLAWGDVPPDVVDGARRTIATVGSADAPIADVPRLGEKLFFVEGREGDHLIAAGCSPETDIEADTTVPIDVWIVPHVHEFGRPNDADLRTANIIATAHWSDDIGVTDRPARLELFGVGGRQFAIDGATGDRGRATLACTASDCDARLPSGPLVKVVRVKWGEAPARIAAFKPFTMIPGSPVAVDPGARPPSSWTTGVITFPGGQDGWAALGVHQAADGTTDGAVVHIGPGGLVRQEYPADGAEAIAIWDKEVWTVTVDGWHQLTPLGLDARRGPIDTAGAAREIVAITDCAQRPSLGLLVRRDAEPYAPFTMPGAPAGDPDPAIETLAGIIGTDTVIGQMCANSTPGGTASETTEVEKLIAVQGPAGIRMIRIIAGAVSTDRVFPLPQVAAVTRFDTGANAGLAGAVITQSGFRVVSFRFADFGPLGDIAVQTTRLDRPIAVQPSSIAVVNLDGDALGDVVAALPTVDGPRVQVVMGVDVAGQPLAAAGAPIEQVPVDARPRIVLENVIGSDDCLELVILTDRVDVVDTHLMGVNSACAHDQITAPQ